MLCLMSFPTLASYLYEAFPSPFSLRTSRNYTCAPVPPSKCQWSCVSFPWISVLLIPLPTRPSTVLLVLLISHHARFSVSSYFPFAIVLHALPCSGYRPSPNTRVSLPGALCIPNVPHSFVPYSLFPFPLPSDQSFLFSQP